jgi:hypothetical protein
MDGQGDRSQGAKRMSAPVMVEQLVLATQESASEREHRVGQYQRERDRDHVLLEELTKAFDFTLTGKEMLGSQEVYVLKGTPRADYRPPSGYAKALTGMQGTLWIDTENFHWVKAEAEVVRPIQIDGFVARIEKGTIFELEQAPIAEGSRSRQPYELDRTRHQTRRPRLCVGRSRLPSALSPGHAARRSSR